MIVADQSKDGGSDKVQNTYTENLALFYLGLQGKYLVPASTIREISNEIKTSGYSTGVYNECAISRT